MQKISLFHHFILEIQQILESQDLKGHPMFDHHHPKIVKVIFGFPEFLSTHQKLVYSIKGAATDMKYFARLSSLGVMFTRKILA